MPTLLKDSTRNIFEVQCRYLDHVAERIGLPRSIHHYLRSPKRELKVSIPVMMDSNELEVFTGYRIQHSLLVGPTKGGIRYTPDLDLDTLRALAMMNSWKNAVMGLPFGGAAGGVDCDPRVHSDSELERITRRYAAEINIIMGPERDIPEPDLQTDSRVMAWIMDTYSEDRGFSVPGVVTGKPASIGGSIDIGAEAAYGAVYVINEALKRRNKSLKGMKVALQGLGRRGSAVARHLVREGATIVALGEVDCTVVNPAGIDPARLIQTRQETGSIRLQSAGECLPADAIVEVDCDILVPAARESLITKDNVGRLNARIIAEVADGAVDFNLDADLIKAGVLLIPSILTSAGGVTVQYFEWVQDLQGFFWDEHEVEEKLSEVMERSLARVWAKADEVKGDLRMSAHMIAVQHVAEALSLRGIYP